MWSIYYSLKIVKKNYNLCFIYKTKMLKKNAWISIIMGYYILLGWIIKILAIIHKNGKESYK